MVGRLEDRVAFGAMIVTRRAELSVEWEINRQIADSIDDLVLRLCLIHPDWYSPSISVGKPDPRGPRAFSTPAPVGQHCQSSHIWGYVCAIPSSRMVADHLYPYEAGGPTDARNLVWLCEWHNQVKSNDIHLWPWDSVDLSWIADVLDRIAARRDLLRRLKQL